MVWIERATQDQRLENLNRLNDAAFADLRDDPRYRRIFGTPSSELSRTEGWRHDLNFLFQEVRRRNPVYSRAPLPDSVVRGIERLHQRIPIRHAPFSQTKWKASMPQCENRDP